MSSINYNASSNVALRSLQSISSQLQQSQTRVATGYKINSSADNSSVWKIATTIRSDVAQNEALQDGIKTAKGNADVASSAIDTVTDILGDIESKIIAAKSANATGKTAIQTEIASLQKQLQTVVSSASFDGTNWVDGSQTSVTVATGYTTTVQTDTINLGTGTSLISKTGTTGILNQNGAVLTTKSVVTFDVTTDNLDNMLTDLQTAQTAVATAGATIGAASARLGNQVDYLDKLNDVKQSALSSLVDTDMEKESARITALQVQQQLATQVLQLANQSSSNILRLFQ